MTSSVAGMACSASAATTTTSAIPGCYRGLPDMLTARCSESAQLEASPPLLVLHDRCTQNLARCRQWFPFRRQRGASRRATWVGIRACTTRGYPGADPGRGWRDPEHGAGPVPGRGQAGARHRREAAQPQRRRPGRGARCGPPTGELAVTGELADLAERAADDLADLVEATRQIAAQTRQRLAGQTPDGATRRVSLHDPDARPIAKGRLGKPVEFGHKAQTIDGVEGDDGVIVDHNVEQGNPPDAPQLAPAVDRVPSVPAVHHARSPPTAATARRPSRTTTCTTSASGTW